MTVYPFHIHSFDSVEKQLDRLSFVIQKTDAVLIAHYYTHAAIQRLVEITSGFVGDSLAMAQFGLESHCQTLIIAGVKFMGETAKILNPEKQVIMPTLQATCSLDIGCPIDSFTEFCDANPDRTVVVYANTSAAVKARADWVVTSSNALNIIRHLDAQGEKILWAPDRYLGQYLQTQTQADMLLWQGSCVVHEEFKKQALLDLKKLYPHAAILVHPESPMDVIAMADVVGSTSRLLQASIALPNEVFIVATEHGIFYQMQKYSPEKTFIEAPTAGHGATCRSCGQCPWMAMNSLDQLEIALSQNVEHEIFLDPVIIHRAQISLQRMLNFS